MSSWRVHRLRVSASKLLTPEKHVPTFFQKDTPTPNIASPTPEASSGFFMQRGILR